MTPCVRPTPFFPPRLLGDEVSAARLFHLSDLEAPQGLGPDLMVSGVLNMLRAGAQELSLRVSGSRVVEGVDDYWSLRLLGCQMAAVSDEARERAGVPLEALGFYDEVTGGWPRVYQSVLDLVRRDRPTPLVMLKAIGRSRLWAKLEWYNPLSLSIKDRTALNLVEWRIHEIRRAGAVYEASSSNTAVALAALSRLFGFRVRAYIPSTSEPFGPQLVSLLGGEVVQAGSSTYELRPLAREEAERDGAVFLNQFESYLNPLAHIRWTAKELDYQSKFGGLRLRAVVVTMGTRGHAAGVATYFRLRRPEVRVIGVQPGEGSSIPGLRRQEGWPWPGFAAPHEVVDVPEDEALRAAVDVSRETGLLFGPSGGAAVSAALRLMRDGGEDGDYVVVVPDHGVKYLRLYIGGREA